MIGLQFRVTSAITGDPVIVAFTGIGRPSENRKTGPMIQMWMLAASHEPHIASKLGLDDAICGECPLRHHLGGGCYVRLHDAPLTVYRTALRGAYPTLELDNPEHIDALRSRPLRIGAYGDPAAIPYQPWMELMQSIAPTAWTGYTHQWRKPQFQHLKSWVMASVQTGSDARWAERLGWRYFRAIPVGSRAARSNEFQCPAESGRRTCATCLACHGVTTGKTPTAHPTISAHGAMARMVRDVALEYHATVTDVAAA